MKFAVLLFSIFSLAFSSEISFKSIQSDFLQKVTSPEGSEIVYKGIFYARNDGNALWIYEKPVNKKIYFQVGRVIIVEPELEQVIVTSLENTPNLSSLLQDALHVKKNQYKATYDGTDYNIFTQNNIPKMIDYLDKLENKVTITLSNTKIDEDIPNETFKVTIPDYFDVINQ